MRYDDDDEKISEREGEEPGTHCDCALIEYFFLFFFFFSPLIILLSPFVVTQSEIQNFFFSENHL
jgi:hypothetical protein